MNPEIKEDWVEALRSGEFYQTAGYLDREGGQCCLGVLCDILDIDWTRGPFGARRYAGGIGWLPHDVMKHVGLKQCDVEDLAAMNDDGATFDQIADYIEANL